jgi:hypothetical protein
MVNNSSNMNNHLTLPIIEHKKTITIYGVGNACPGLVWTQTWGVLNPVN